MTTYDLPIFNGDAAHKPILVFLTIVLISLCSFGPVMAIPVGGDPGEHLRGLWGGRATSAPPSPIRYIVTHGTNMMLQIEDNGRVSGTKCKTEYAALQTKTNTVKSKESGIDKHVAVIFAIKTKRYLCITEKGEIYSEPEENFNKDNCGFFFDINWVNRKDERNETIVYSLSRVRHHQHKMRNSSLYIGMKCDGTPFTVHGCRQRRYYRKEIRFNFSVFNRDSVTNKCSTKPTCPRTYLKFCRKVMKNFFTTSVKNWRRFLRRKCFRRLKREELKTQKINKRCDPHSVNRRKRRHSHHRRGAT